MERTEFRLTPGLPKNGPESLVPGQEKKLVLSANEVNVHWLLDQVRQILPGRREEAWRELLGSNRVWSRALLEPNKLSLKDLGDFEKHFEWQTGAILLPEIPPSSPSSNFYHKPGRTFIGRAGRQNRGPSYYLTTDPAVGSPEQKLAVLKEDFADALNVLEKTQSPTSREEFLLCAGVLDYLKQHSLALYHVLVQPEKEGRTVSPELTELKNQAFKLAQNYTRQFYLSLLGRTIDHNYLSKEQVLGSIDEISKYILSDLNNVEYFKLPETDHPLRILLSAYRAAEQNPDVDVIIALPRGSTQLGIVTELMFNLSHGYSPKLVMIPVSLYSKRTVDNGEPLDEQFAKYMRQAKLDFRRDTVLIVDDNTHSGRTLQTVLDAEGKAQIATTKVNSIMIGELDPIRIENLYSKGQPPKEITNFLNPDILGTALWIAPIMRKKRENTYELRKYIARKILLSGMKEKFIERRNLIPNRD